jgi:uncharacterized protein YbcI
MPDTQRVYDRRAALGPAIAKATGHLLNKFTGRGPTNARTFVSDELISVVLSDTMTTGERSLYRDGGAVLVLALRHAYQQAMGPELIAAVEALSGQRVLAFLSDNHLEPDIAIESFVLVPRAVADGSGESHRDGEETHANGARAMARPPMPS